VVPDAPPPRPNITAAQIVGLLVAALPVLASIGRVFGLYDLTAEQIVVLNDVLQWAAVVAGTLFVADAGLRAARNQAVAKVQQAQILAGAPAAAAAVVPDDLAARVTEVESQLARREGVPPVP
jgi:hypothetical protein